jgi:hypothetical protein
MKIKLIIPGVLLSALITLHVSAQNLDVRPAVLSASGGRYVFGQVSSFRGDKYMLDTQSGRLWQIVTDTNNAILLQPVPYVSIDGTVTSVVPTPQEVLQNTAPAGQSDVKDAVDQKQNQPTNK